MENWVVPLHLKDHAYSQIRRASGRRSERKPQASTHRFSCRNDEDPAPHHSTGNAGTAPRVKRPRSPIPLDELPSCQAPPAAGRKRKRTSVAHPTFEELTQDPGPQHSTGDAGTAPRVKRPRSPIPLDELPSCPAPPAAGRKRKRASVARPTFAVPFAELTQDPAPQHSTDDAGITPRAKRPRSPIPPDELPSVCTEVLQSQPSTAPLPDDSPLMIHHFGVPEYQEIYHAVVDEKLRYKSGRLRPYSLDLGRRLKQKLWERLDRPTFTETVSETGLVQVNVSYGAGVYPPLYDVDVSLEPQPK